jgi:hypothetical protein
MNDPNVAKEEPMTDVDAAPNADAPAPNADAPNADAAPVADSPDAPAGSADSRDVTELAAIVESLLFLSQDPVKTKDLAEAMDAEPQHIEEALAQLQQRKGGLVLREIAGGWTLASIPEAEKAARRLLAKPRTPPLTQAQAECLSIVAYLQPVSAGASVPPANDSTGTGAASDVAAGPPARISPALSRRSRSSPSSSGLGSNAVGSGSASSDARPKRRWNSGVVL